MSRITYTTSIINRFGRNHDQVIVREPSHEFTDVGRLAIQFAVEWGKIPFAPDGEDSAGRQAARRIPVDQVVRDAVAAAEAMEALLFERGHVIEMPPLNLDEAT